MGLGRGRGPGARTSSMALVWALAAASCCVVMPHGALGEPTRRDGARPAIDRSTSSSWSLNLLPILPLDGGRILVEPAAEARRVALRAASSSGACQLLTAVLLFAVFDGWRMRQADGASFAPLGNLARLLVRAIVYG